MKINRTNCRRDRRLFRKQGGHFEIDFDMCYLYFKEVLLIGLTIDKDLITRIDDCLRVFYNLWNFLNTQKINNFTGKRLSQVPDYPGERL